MTTKHVYSSPECDYGLFRDYSILCDSTDYGTELDDLVDNTENIEWNR